MEQQNIGHLLKNITDKLKTKADADLKSHGLTLTQSRVLAYLNQRGGQATQKEIQMFLKASHPTVVGVLARMEKNGFLSCSFQHQGSGTKTVQLTEKAHAIAQRLTATICRQEAIMVSSLTEEEVVQLRNLLIKLHSNLE